MVNALKMGIHGGMPLRSNHYRYLMLCIVLNLLRRQNIDTVSMKTNGRHLTDDYGSETTTIRLYVITGICPKSANTLNKIRRGGHQTRELFVKSGQ